MELTPYGIALRQRKHPEELTPGFVGPASGLAGTENPYYTQADIDANAVDLTSQEHDVEQQRAIANQLRNTATPEGREVGPSHIYVGPNWGEQLGSAVQKIMGGYMTGQATEADKALDTQRLAKAKAAATIAEGQRKETMDFNVDKAVAAETGREATLEEQKAEALQAHQDRQAALAIEEKKAKTAQYAAEHTKTGKTSSAMPKEFTLPNGTKVWAVRGQDGMEDASTGAPVDLTGARMTTDKTDYQRDESLKNYGKATKDALDLGERVRALDTLIKPYADKGALPGEIPGTGALEKSDSWLGSVARTAADIGDAQSPAENIDSARRGVLNVIIHNQAGMSQTVSEIKRLTGESATDLLNKPEVFFKYYDRLKDFISADLKHLASSTDQDTIDRYRSNLSPNQFDVTRPQFDRFEFGSERSAGRGQPVREKGVPVTPTPDGIDPSVWVFLKPEEQQAILKKRGEKPNG